MPITRERGKPETAIDSWVMPSTGLATTMRMQSGERSTTCRTTPDTIFALVITRSSRDIPGLRGMPLVITTIFDPAVSSYPLVPVTSESYPTIGPDWSMSRALP